jgi:hypothetical protein
MVVLYALWHGTAGANEHRRSAADELLGRYEQNLTAPTVPAFVVGLFSGESADWTVEQWLDLAQGEAGRT